MIKGFVRNIIRFIASLFMQVEKHFLPQKILNAYKNGKFPVMGW